MKKKYIVGNWKMNLGGEAGLDLAKQLDAELSHDSETTVIISPPFTMLREIRRHTEAALAAQDCSSQVQGAYTGDISAAMLKEAGCQYVIVGHSERRTYHHETNDLIHQKAKAAAAQGLIPIVCVGETAEEYDAQKTKEVIAAQLEGLCKDIKFILVAYEPRWAIGTGKVPTLQEIEDVHAYILTLLPQFPVIYGGSVTPENAQDILNISSVSGVLVGGASLDLAKFLSICKGS